MKRLFVFSAFLSVLVLLSNYVQAVDWVYKRTQMIDMHLTPRGIWSPAVLKAMKQVPRHEFVPQHIRNLAYADSPLPIGEGQTISQPYVVAWMSQPQSSFKTLAFIFSLAAQSGLHRKVTGEDAVLVVEKSVCG